MIEHLRRDPLAFVEAMGWPARWPADKLAALVMKETQRAYEAGREHRERETRRRWRESWRLARTLGQHRVVVVGWRPGQKGEVRRALELLTERDRVPLRGARCRVVVDEVAGVS